MVYGCGYVLHDIVGTTTIIFSLADMMDVYYPHGAKVIGILVTCVVSLVS
jgi:hypothetical protein